jgi:hypothetical protein
MGEYPTRPNTKIGLPILDWVHSGNRRGPNSTFFGPKAERLDYQLRAKSCYSLMLGLCGRLISALQNANDTAGKAQVLATQSFLGNGFTSF